MSLDSPQIVNSLISFYKRQGADLTYLLGDPIFQKLPLEDRVNAIKTHAATILAGTPERLNKEERSLIKGEIGAGAVGGAITAFGIGKAVMSNPSFAHTISKHKALALMGGMAVVAGALGGLAVGRLKTDSLLQKRHAIRNELALAASQPSTNTAIGVLSSAPLHSITSVNRENILGKIVHKLDDIVQGPIKETLTEEFPRQYVQFRLHNIQDTAFKNQAKKL